MIKEVIVDNCYIFKIMTRCVARGRGLGGFDTPQKNFQFTNAFSEKNHNLPPSFFKIKLYLLNLEYNYVQS